MCPPADKVLGNTIPRKAESAYSARLAPLNITWIWLVRLCGATERVAYLAPVERLAEPPFGPTRLGRLANASLVRFARLISGPVALYYRRQGRRARPTPQKALMQ